MNILSIFCGAVATLLLALPPSLHAQTDSLILGNCNRQSVGYEQAGSGDGPAGFALHYGAERMQAYSGCRITGVCLNINYLEGMGAVRVFVSTTLDGEPLAEQRYTPTRGGWTMVPFDKPYTVDGGAVYIGYEVSGVRFLPYAVRIVDGGEEWKRRAGDTWQPYTGNYSAAMYAVVRGDALPANDIALGHVSMPGYTRTGEPFGYEGSFTNLGTSAVSSLQFTLHAGDTRQTVSVGGLNVAPRTVGTFSIGGLTLTDEGSYDTWLEADGVNGAADAAPYDNLTRRKRMVCSDAPARRKILLEVFSTERCNNCPAAHRLLESVFGDKDDIVEVGHHAGFYTDWLTADESVETEWLYGSRLYAPAVTADRTAFADNLPSVYPSATPLFAPDADVLRAVYAEAEAIPAFVTLDLRPALDADARRLSLSVKGAALPYADATRDARLTVILTEDSIFSTTQSGASDGFYHRHSVRRYLTPTWGTGVDVKEGFESTFTADIPTGWEMRNMHVVAFVADYNADDRTACRVLNTETAALADLLPTAIRTASTATRPDITVSDGRISVSGGCSRLTLTDMSGRTIIDVSEVRTTVDASHLTHGIYVVSVVKDGQTLRAKITVR